MLRVPENLERLILDVLDQKPATARELEKIIFGRRTPVGKELVRRALQRLQSSGEVASDGESWLRWSAEKEKAWKAQKRKEARARQAKARQEREKAQRERARREAEEREKAEQERARQRAGEREKADQERAGERADEWENADQETGRRGASSRLSKDRETLAKILGMLGSDHEGEKLSAAEQAEKFRRKLGMTWAQLLHVE